MKINGELKETKEKKEEWHPNPNTALALGILIGMFGYLYLRKLDKFLLGLALAVVLVLAFGQTSALVIATVYFAYDQYHTAKEMNKNEVNKPKATNEFLMTYGWAILTIVIVVAVLWNMAAFKEPTRAQSSYFTPENINMFSAVSEGEVLRFFFVLEDDKGKNTVDDGTASIQIKDSRNKIVFAQKFNVKASDFTDYGYQLTGNEIGKAYEWRVDQRDIQRGLSTGTANMTFTTANGKILTATASYVKIPEDTQEEIKQIYEDEYNKNAKVNGTTKTKGNFEITLVKYGFFTHLKYGTWGEEVTDFRVDLKVKNIGTDIGSFNTYDDTVISGSNQYKISDSELDTSDMYPGVIKEGYLLFKEVPKTLSGPVKIIAGSSYNAAYHKLTTEFDVVV